MFGKTAVLLGMIFGPIADAYGRHHALLVIIAFFLLGAVLLFTIPITPFTDEGE